MIFQQYLRMHGAGHCQEEDEHRRWKPDPERSRRLRKDQQTTSDQQDAKAVGYHCCNLYIHIAKKHVPRKDLAACIYIAKSMITYINGTYTASLQPDIYIAKVIGH